MYTWVNVCPSLFLQTLCSCIYKEMSVCLSSFQTHADVFPFLTILSSKYPPSLIPPLLMPSESNCGRLGSPPQTIKVCFLFVPPLTRRGRIRSPWAGIWWSGKQVSDQRSDLNQAWPPWPQRFKQPDRGFLLNTGSNICHAESHQEHVWRTTTADAGNVRFQANKLWWTDWH